jgi:hypothetical protein
LSELVLLLLNIDCLQQFEDFCQSLFYFYYILTAFNNLKIFSRTSSDKNLQIVESCQYLVEVEQALTNLQIVESCQYLVEEQALTKSSNCWKLTTFNNLEIFVRACSTSTTYWQLSTIWRFLSELVLLPNTDSFQQFEDFVRACSSTVEQDLTKSSNCWKLSVFGRSRTSSDKNLQIVQGGQYFEDFCHSLFYFY